MKEKDTYLPKLEVPEAFIRDLRQSIEVYRPRVTDGKPELMPAPLKRNFALLALIADVGDVFANLNVVLEDLDKLEADPFAFGDTDPFARFKFLLRSIHAEFERFSGLFDQGSRPIGTPAPRSMSPCCAASRISSRSLRPPNPITPRLRIGRRYCRRVCKADAG
jgi:hypothetical protein